MDVFLVEPRGFCAGVRHALAIVTETLEKYGSPVYVRHEIVHNKHVIDDLKQKGVIFVEGLDEVEDTSRPVIFSAHGVSAQVKQHALNLGLQIIDATCPLVNAVHLRIKKLEESGNDIIVIGKATHPEILGTIGQLKDPNHAHIVSSLEDVNHLRLPENISLGIVTQTTLAVEETKDILNALQQKFPQLSKVSHPNICFATTNRQNAVRELARLTPNILILGSKNSSNSTHLREAALRYGAQQAWLVDDASDIDWKALHTCQSLGISAGASAPEYLVEEVISELQRRYLNINIHHVKVAEEKSSF